MSQDIALAVYHYLERNNLTQKKFAEMMGVSQAYVTKILRGSENLTLETIGKLENALGEKIVHVERPYEFTVTVSFASHPSSRPVAGSRKYSGKAVDNNLFAFLENESYAV